MFVRIKSLLVEEFFVSGHAFSHAENDPSLITPSGQAVKRGRRLVL